MMSVYYDFKCLVLKNKKIYLSKKIRRVLSFSFNEYLMILLRPVIFYFTEKEKKVKELISIILAKSSSQDFTVKPSIINTKMPIFVWNFQNLKSYDVAELLKTLDKLNHERFAAAKLKAWETRWHQTHFFWLRLLLFLCEVGHFPVWFVWH